MTDKKPGSGEHSAGIARSEKQAEHIGKIQRTAVASLMGIIAGVLSFQMSTGPSTASIGILFLLAGIVFQKYIFIVLRITTTLTAKDWFYQGFMTLAFWYISWTLLLTATGPVTP